MSMEPSFIAERILDWKGRRLFVRLYPPVAPKDDTGWRCYYEFVVEDDKRSRPKREAFGEDSLQALTLALKAINLETEKEYPEAYVHSADYGHGFSDVFHSGMPRVYDMRLRKHVKRERDRKEQELWDEILRLRRRGRGPKRPKRGRES